jgi:fibronectin type III domain protein
LVPVFPKREAEILELAQHIISGLTAGSGDFPAPPVSVADLQAALDSAKSADDAAIAAHAVAELATVTKRAGFDQLIAAMRADLRYSEDAVAYNDAKLNSLGWAGKATRSPQDPPGQPLGLEAPEQGEGWVSLEWKTPADGGRARSYRIERREGPDGDWSIAETAFDTRVALTGQDRGKEWEYRVIAMNKAGEGMPSNTIMAVL